MFVRADFYAWYVAVGGEHVVHEDWTPANNKQHDHRNQHLHHLSNNVIMLFNKVRKTLFISLFNSLTMYAKCTCAQKFCALSALCEEERITFVRVLVRVT